MMSGVEAHGHGPLHGGVFPGKGLHLGHMRGTAEGPPGLRPSEAETREFVRGPGKGDDAREVGERVLAEADAIFAKADADGDGQIGRTEFYDFTELVVRDGLKALLAGLDGGGGDDDDAADDVAAPPPAVGDDGGDGFDGGGDGGIGGVAAAPADAPGGVAATPEGELGGVAAAPEPEAPVAAPSGDPVFDLTLSSIADAIDTDAAAESALALLEASQGYSEAAAAA